MKLVDECDRPCEVANRCAALDAVLTPLIENGTISAKLRQSVLQQYTTELQALLKRITLGL